MSNAGERAPANTGTGGSSISPQELVMLKRMLLLTQEDEQYLNKAAAILQGHEQDLLNAWQAYILANDYLSQYFSTGINLVNALSPRFSEWITQLCTRNEDGRWQQFEQRIALQLKKEDVLPGIPPVFLRYLTTFVYPVTQAANNLLASAGHSAAEVKRMEEAWFKAVSLSVVLWSYQEKGGFTLI
ncbi:protoglobin domain-containing protein [Chitinophaga vietnamensis]|uniref:protoglobin domain-containing protein n=1 Tax=Chitinophaga vietnamensis TaxID=2593957 RepID=UPI00117890A3|nr:protoglobin domain-containing protein [Chitinophaga vietnamensis]